MLVKFSSDKPLLPWWRKLAIFNTKSAITYLVHEVRPRCLHAVGGFQDRPIKWWLSNFAQTTPVARPYLGHQAWSWTTLRKGNVFITFTNDFYFCQGFTFLTFFLFLFERFLHLCLCLHHDAREAAYRAGPSATADIQGGSQKVSGCTVIVISRARQ